MKTFEKQIKQLTPEQYRITQENGTERPFDNEYCHHDHAGIYVDVVSGEALFCSLDKYDAGCGWPSFTRPIKHREIIERTDQTHGLVRTEVRSHTADSHLGHVFDDGPAPSTLRYCINSAALRFIPVDKLADLGYAECLPQFQPDRGVAILAAGCFWGVEDLFAKHKGVIHTLVGYTGGQLAFPTYEQVCTGHTGHAEAIQIVFDKKITHFQAIIEFFFKMHDPTTMNQQGNDRGSQYRSAIFPIDEKQHDIANQVIRAVNQSGFWSNKIVTQIEALGRFYPAEAYHQHYLKKHPGGYHCHFIRS